ncbi:hypothetical protein SLA2020_083350 [Shorea laevis]
MMMVVMNCCLAAGRSKQVQELEHEHGQNYVNEAGNGNAAAASPVSSINDDNKHHYISRGNFNGGSGGDGNP